MIIIFISVIYNSYIVPNNVTTDTDFLRYEFTEVLLDALGIKDESGVIYELVNYRYFADEDLGDWDAMIDGMVNVSKQDQKSNRYDCILQWLQKENIT